MSAPRVASVHRADAPVDPGAESSSRVESPTLRGRLHRGRVWIVLGAITAVVVVVTLVMQGAATAPGQRMGTDNPAPTGSKALAVVLADHGVEVTAARSLPAALDALDSAGVGASSTLLVYDETAILSGERMAELTGVADRLVVVAPDFDALRELAPGVRFAGGAAGALDEVDCDVEAAESAESLSAGQRLFTIDENASFDGWVGCFADGDAGGTDAYALVQHRGVDGTVVTIVGASVAFENGTITEGGNAALAVGLLGASEHLVWYLPGPTDTDAATGVAPTALLPGWGIPALALLVLVTIAAGIWRGRRFGPLVVEDLPVHVPVGETSEGRARLYARSRARGRALDQLRMGAIGRIARALRLSPSVHVDSVVTAAAEASDRDVASVRRVLVEQLPHDDRELVDLAGRLADLEAAVERGVRPDATPAVASDQTSVAPAARAFNPSTPEQPNDNERRS